MSDYTIYALRTECDEIYSSLNDGEGRFGWSYIETADLRELEKRIESDRWDSLSEKEQDCYQRFLLDFKKSDFVVYINVPEWGQCTLARVTGPYFWRYDRPDFNHRFPVDPASVSVFDRNDAIVYPTLSAKLKLQGRYWRIYDLHKEFEDLVNALKDDKGGKPSTPATRIDFLKNEIQPDLKAITGKIQRTHPGSSLESLLAKIFRNIPRVKEVKEQGGAGDHGADLRVIFESGFPFPGLQQDRTCVVQVKSFEGEHWDTKAVDDILRALRYWDADMGLIVSTAASGSEALDKALYKLRKETRKPVHLLLGEDVAAFVLHFGDQILF